MNSDVVLSMTLPVKSYILEEDGSGYPLVILERYHQKEWFFWGWMEEGGGPINKEPVWVITKTRQGVLNKKPRDTHFLFCEGWDSDGDFTFSTAVEAWQWWEANRERIIVTPQDYRRILYNEKEDGE